VEVVHYTTYKETIDELQRWRKSFDGHVYVTNQEYSDLIKSAKTQLGRIREAAEAVWDRYESCGVIESDGAPCPDAGELEAIIIGALNKAAPKLESEVEK
jgi:hypothetical protein